jgi:hypothetical protein
MSAPGSTPPAQPASQPVPSAGRAWIPVAVIAVVVAVVVWGATQVGGGGTLPTLPGGPGRPTFQNLSIIGRSGHTATVLQDGRVLVAGGLGVSEPLTSSVIFDPSSGQWTVVGSLSNGRYDHTATLLSDGRVLVVGGCCASGSKALDTGEVFDPGTGRWTTTASMRFVRTSHAAGLLPDGRVLVVGGGDETGVMTSAEIYEPTSGAWTAGPSMNVARSAHRIDRLPSGNLVVLGGCCTPDAFASAEIFEVERNQWSTIQLSSPEGTTIFAAGILDNGLLYAVTTGPTESGSVTVATLDEATREWSALSSQSTVAFRSIPDAASLPGGRVLLSGDTVPPGAGQNAVPSAAAVVFETETSSWRVTGATSTPRVGSTIALLPGGRVLATGGSLAAGLEGRGDSAPFGEMYQPDAGVWAPVASPTS